jgi:5''-nucleotidase/2'',3''-cyclic phosphodiesterase and related esterases
MKHRLILPFSFAMALLTVSPQAAQSQSNKGENTRRYVITSVKGKFLTVDSAFDREHNIGAERVLQAYKKKVEEVMSTQIGTSAQLMKAAERANPEGLLSNLIADVIRSKGSDILGKPCDMALMNIGGIRSILPKGKITVANIYEILPFENTISIVILNGTQLMELMREIVRYGGGVSGVSMVVSKEPCRLIDATVGGQPIKAEKTYTVATLNYLAEGNDGFKVFAEKGVKHINRDDVLVRETFMHYVKNQMKQGKEVESKIGGRIVFK